MQTTNMSRRSAPLGSLISSMLGIILLLPATSFIIAILLRICGSKSLYYFVAPSFLQSPFNLFAFHKAQFILGCLFLSVLCNVFSILKFNLLPGKWGWDVEVSYRRYWLNTAIALQSALLLIVLIAYALIQHVRY
ncbi:MAG: hypothetical protein ABUM51_03615 [Bacteroidota bacterium]